MRRRSFAKALMGVFVAAPALSVSAPAAPAIPKLRFEMGQKVRWLRPTTGMPTIGHIIGLQQRLVGTELEEKRCYIDFETLSGGTKLWLGTHELEPVA